MAELKLRNCPFCGGKAELRIASEIWHSGGQVEIGGWKVACQNCGIETALENRDTAIAKWNRRADSRGKYEIFGAACKPCWVMDCIEEFENAPAVNRWIPCAERMPEKDASVLIYAAGHRVTAYYDNCKNLFRLTENDNLYYIAEYVTHWMPLPESPEKE